MELNRRRYNIIIFTLIVLISAVIIFSAVEITDKKQDNVANKDSTIAEAEDKNSLKEEEKNSEVEIVENKNYLPNASTYSNGWVALNSAYKILDKYSFKSEKSQSGVNDEIKIAGISFVVRQNLSEIKYKTNKECLITTLATCNNSEGANYYKYTYFNKTDKTVTQRATNTSKKFTNENVENYTFDEYKNQTAINDNGLYYKLNSGNATLDSFKMAGSNYVLKLTLKANSNGFNDLGKFILSSPVELRNPKVESVTFEIKIDRKTGSFKSIKTTERYSVEKKTNIAGWQASTITTVSEENFTFADINIDALVKSTVIK